MQALAQGGFQVEALARLQYPNGVFVDAENYEYDKAIEITKQHFETTNVCLYEAAFATENLFVRSDIVKKDGSAIKLIEVKSKSYDSADQYALIGKKGVSWQRGNLIFLIWHSKNTSLKNLSLRLLLLHISC